MQEPQLDESKTVLENVEEGVARSRRSSTASRRSRRRWPTRRRLRHAAGRDGHAEGKDRAARCLGARQPARTGDGCAALPARRLDRHATSPVVSAPRRALQAAAPEARPAAARRADQPPGRRERAVARAAPREVPGHRSRRHPRPVLPRQRRPSGSSSSTAATPTPTRATTRPTWRRRRRGSQVQGKKDPSSQAAAATNWSGCAATPSGRQAKSKARLARYEEMAAEAEKTRKLDFEEIQIPPGPRLGNWWSRRRPGEGLRRARC